VSMLTPRGTGARPLRRRRPGGPALLLVVVTLAAIVAASWWGWTRTEARPQAVHATPTPSCPAPAPEAAPPGEVKVNVYNAADRRGLAARVAGELDRRGFRVKDVDNDPAGRAVTAVAEVRHGPAGVAAARTVAAEAGLGTVTVADQRRGAVVDLVVGTAFVRLVDRAAAAAALSPPPPPGC